MFKVEDILARLQNGEDAGDIAEEVIQAINTANEQFQKEEEAKAKKAEHLKEAQKMADLQQIIDLMHDFCIEYYCDSEEDIDTVHAAFATLDAKSVNKMIEEAGAYAVKMAEMQKHMDTLLGGIFEAPTVKKSAPAPKTRTADAVIGDFLSSMGLK
jgi:hypothetical protein